MDTVYLIRHGQKEKLPGDPGLTKLGFRQARLTGKYLHQFPITDIFSSPFARAIQTAEVISGELNLDHKIHRSLEERMNWSIENGSYNQFLTEWTASTNSRDYVPKHGSSSRETGERIKQLLDSLSNDRDQNHIVLITHGGAIADYLRTLFDDSTLLPIQKEYEHGCNFQIHNCSISKVVLANTPQLEMLDYVEHLSIISE